NANALQPYRHRQLFAAIVEQRGLLRDADQMSRKCSCLHAPPLIELAEMSYSLLNDATTDTNAAHEAPIAMKLPVLPYRRVAQVHAPNQIRLVVSRKSPKLALHAQISALLDLSL